MSYGEIDSDFEKEFHGEPQIPSFLIIPSEALKLGFNEAIILGIITVYSKGSLNACKLKNQSIANMLDKSTRFVSEAISNLDKHGFIQVHLTINEKGTFRTITVPKSGVEQVGAGVGTNDLGGRNSCSIQKNSKENSKEKEDNIAFEIIKYLNQVAKKNFSLKNKESLRFITARLADHAPEVLKAVIDLKCSQWIKDEKMNRYLRPETLFNSTKFETYFNELSAPKLIPVNNNKFNQHNIPATPAVMPGNFFKEKDSKPTNNLNQDAADFGSTPT